MNWNGVITSKDPVFPVETFGSLVSVTISTANNNGWNSGDTGTLTGGSGTGGTYTVTDVDVVGEATGLTIENKGQNYVVGDTLTLSSDTANATCTVTEVTTIDGDGQGNFTNGGTCLAYSRSQGKWVAGGRPLKLNFDASFDDDETFHVDHVL